MNICPYTDEKCNSGDCTKCNVYFEIEYGCDADCDNCIDSDCCDHLASLEGW